MYSDYQFITSNRTTLAIEINAKAQVIVRMPRVMSRVMVERFLTKKQDWIQQKQAQVRQKTIQNPRSMYRYQIGEKFLYLGDFYPLNLTDNEIFNFDGKVFNCPRQAKQNQAQLLFLAWYKNQFKHIILPRLENYAKQHALPFNQVRLKTQKTRWGSCSASNNINLNYLLIQAPIKVIDYVLIHELAHTIHKHHQADFYKLVASICPNYKQYEQWLKAHQSQIHAIMVQ